VCVWKHSCWRDVIIRVKVKRTIKCLLLSKKTFMVVYKLPDKRFITFYFLLFHLYWGVCNKTNSPAYLSLIFQKTNILMVWKSVNWNYEKYLNLNSIILLLFSAEINGLGFSAMCMNIWKTSWGWAVPVCHAQTGRILFWL
jgi:hypothetical protein